MTKKERVARLQKVLVDLLMPEPGGRKLYVDIQARSKDDLLFQMLRGDPGQEQTMIRFEIWELDIVRRMHDALIELDEDEV